jgi:hypothetical protein
VPIICNTRRGYGSPGCVIQTYMYNTSIELRLPKGKNENRKNKILKEETASTQTVYGTGTQLSRECGTPDEGRDVSIYPSKKVKTVRLKVRTLVGKFAIPCMNIALYIPGNEIGSK